MKKKVGIISGCFGWMDGWICVVVMETVTSTEWDW